MPDTQPPVAVEHNPNRATEEAERLVQCAKAIPLSDGGLQTSQLLRAALEQDPSHHEAQILLERLHQTFVPRWHFPMLADQARNRAYAEAIAAKVRPGDIVLDIGCGAGLTAMLAARAGAKHVYTCEQQPLIAQAAERVIAANGLSDRITVIPKWSHDIIIGQDMPEAADLVISEIVDTVLLGEGALATLTHAMQFLAKPEARAIPERGTLYAQPVQSAGLLDLWRPRQAEGFDLSAFHHLARVAQLPPHDFEACNLRSLGQKTPIFTYDFARPSVAAGRCVTDLTCTSVGSIHAVLVTFEMELAPGIKVANGLGDGGHWGRTAYLLDTHHHCRAGDSLAITAQHDADRLSLCIDGFAQAPAAKTYAPIWAAPGWRPVQAHEKTQHSSEIDAAQIWHQQGTAGLPAPEQTTL